MTYTSIRLALKKVAVRTVRVTARGAIKMDATNISLEIKFVLPL